MTSAFETRAASFDPEQTAALATAYNLALKSFPSEGRMPSGTKAKLAKVIVNMGREQTRQHVAIDPQDISTKAAAYVTHLRSLSLLD